VIFANAFLRWVVSAQPGDDREPEFTWMNLPESWGVFVFIGIVVALGLFVFWTYIKELKTAPFPLRVLLGVLRFTVLFLLVLVFLKPSISFKKEKVRKPNVVLAVDVSSSMAIGDEYRDPVVVTQLAEKFGYSEEDLKTGQVTRLELVQKAIDLNEQGFLNLLQKKASVRVNEFESTNKTAATLNAVDEKSDSAKSKPSADSDLETNASGKQTAVDSKGSAVDPDGDPEAGPTAPKDFKLSSPTGNGTDIWLALQEAIETTQVASIVLISDGQATGGNDPYNIARDAKKKGIPIYTVGVGDPYKTKNVWIKDIVVPPQAVNPGDPFDVLGIIGFQRIDIKNINVQLVRQEIIGNNFGPEEEPMTKVVTLPDKTGEEDEQGIVEVKFRPALTNPGKYRYQLRIMTEIPDEEKTDDNMRFSSDVEVTDEKTRVLLISGAPTWEYQLVQRLLQRDPTYELSCWLQSMDTQRQQEGNISIDRLPETLLEFSEYNAVIMIDPDPQRDLDKNFFDLLEKFVEEKAGGVMFMAGPKYTSMALSLSKSENLRKILPVEFPDASASLMGFDGAASTSTKMEINIPNINNQVMRFFQDPNENLNQWQAMPGVYWSYPAAKATPIAKILIEHGDITLAVDSESPRPLLVAGRYGLGNTLYMGFNGTWRWRRVGRQAHFFDAFWINVAKFLVANRSLQGSSRGTVDTDLPNYEIGTRVFFHGTFLDPQMKKSTLPAISAGVYVGDEKIDTIQFKYQGSPGDYVADWLASRVGSVDVRADIGGAVVSTTVKIEQPRAEMKSTALNASVLKEIAKESGGEYFSIDNLEQLAGLVYASPQRIEQSTSPEPIWGMPEVRRSFLLMCFLLPFVLLTTEWALRKAFKLL